MTTATASSAVTPDVVIVEKASESDHSINAMIRCDSCGAQARNVAVKGSLRLYFCNHHERANESGLLRSGFSIEKHSYVQ